MCWCWPFADAWLEDPPELTTPSPPQPEKVEYEYVSVPCPCGCKPPSHVGPTPTMAPKDEDYEHWPDNANLQTVAATPAPRYDNHNGLYEHVYRPAGKEVKDAAPEAPKQAVAPPPQGQYLPYSLQIGYGGQMPYGGQMGYGGQMPAPCMNYPAPAYYGYGGGPAPYAAMAPAYAAPKYSIQPPAAPAPAEAAKPKPKSPRKWQGRTKAEVEEDDMKIAASQGAYAERKVQPIGLADDQVVWVVEIEGVHSLRTFAEVKEAKGEWKADPRFKDSWYFVREAEEKKGKK